MEFSKFYYVLQEVPSSFRKIILCNGKIKFYCISINWDFSYFYWFLWATSLILLFRMNYTVLRIFSFCQKFGWWSDLPNFWCTWSRKATWSKGQVTLIGRSPWRQVSHECGFSRKRGNALVSDHNSCITKIFWWTVPELLVVY